MYNNCLFTIKKKRTIRQMIRLCFFKKKRKIKIIITYSLFGGVGGGGESSTDETLKVSKLTEVSPLIFR